MKQIESPKLPVIEHITKEGYHITYSQLSAKFKRGELKNPDAIYAYAHREKSNKSNACITYKELELIVQVGKELEEEE